MTGLVLNGDTSGSIALNAPAVAGTNTLTLAAASGTLAPLVSGTAQATTSGTFKDFTGIPAYAKRITVMFNGVSTNGASILQIQLGDSGGIEATGYSAMAALIGTTANWTRAGFATTGFVIQNLSAASNVNSGSVVLSLLDLYTWTCQGVLSDGVFYQQMLSGAKTLSGILDRIRITTVNGTDTFDAGTVNVMWE